MSTNNISTSSKPISYSAALKRPSEEVSIERGFQALPSPEAVATPATKERQGRQNAQDAKKEGFTFVSRDTFKSVNPPKKPPTKDAVEDSFEMVSGSSTPIVVSRPATPRQDKK